MASLTAIRERRRASRLEQLASAIADVLSHHPGSSVWLFGSLARGDWDGLSDVDLLEVAPDGVAARALADELLARGLADDAIPPCRIALGATAQRRGPLLARHRH